MTTFVTMHRVPIMDVGEWDALSGDGVFTLDHLQSIVSAQSDSHVPSARLKIGHWIDPDGQEVTFASEPVFGTLANYEIDGLTLYCDIIGVPSWFAEIWPTAFPSRSIEGWKNFNASSGKNYPMILTALSLLGVHMPAVSTLPDLAELYSSEDVPEGVVLASYKGGKPVPPEQAAVSVDNLRRSFYDDFAQGDYYWWWIREVQLDPQQVIADDDDGNLLRVTYTLSGDEVTWGEPVPVEIIYQDKVAAAAAGGTTMTVFASAADSRPEGRNKEKDMAGNTKVKANAETDPKPDEPETKPDEPGTTDDPKPDEPEIKSEVATVTVPEGMVLVDAETLELLKAGAKAGADARAEQLSAKNSRILDDAVKAGKFAPSQRERFSKLLEADPEGTEALIGQLADGLVPVEQRSSAKEGGTGSDRAASNGDASDYPGEWLGTKERAKVAAHYRDGGDE